MCITNTCWNTCNPTRLKGWTQTCPRQKVKFRNSVSWWSQRGQVINKKKYDWYTLYTGIHSSARDIEWSIIIWCDIKFIRTFCWILFRILILDPFWWVRCPWPVNMFRTFPAFYTTNPNRKATRKTNNRQWTLPSKWQNCQCSPATKCTQK